MNLQIIFRGGLGCTNGGLRMAGRGNSPLPQLVICYDGEIVDLPQTNLKHGDFP